MTQLCSVIIHDLIKYNKLFLLDSNKKKGTLTLDEVCKISKLSYDYIKNISCIDEDYIYFIIAEQTSTSHAYVIQICRYSGLIAYKGYFNKGCPYGFGSLSIGNGKYIETEFILGRSKINKKIQIYNDNTNIFCHCCFKGHPNNFFSLFIN